MNRPDGSGLLGVEAQPFAGYRKVGSPVGEGGRFACQLAKSFPAQSLQRRIVKLQLRNLVTPDPPLTQCGQSLLLFRGAFEAVDIDSLALFGSEPVPLRRRAGRFPLAKHDRQGVEQHIADRMMIVVGRPQQQSPDGRRKYRFGIQRVDNWLELIQRQFAAFADGGHNPNTLLLTERHAHAAACFDRHSLR